MTVQLTLPESIERRLRADVRAGRHATLQDAVLERIARGEEFLALSREARRKTFAQIMEPVRKQSGHVDEDEVVKLVEHARGSKRGETSRRRRRTKR